MITGLAVHDVTEVVWDVLEKARVLVVTTADGDTMRIALFPKSKEVYARTKLAPKDDTYA